MRIIGSMVIGPGEADRYLERSLDEIARLCDDAMIVLNNPDSKTEQMVKKRKHRLCYDNREWGKEQPFIKEKLARNLSQLKPDCVLSFDADEVFSQNVSRETLEEMAKTDAVAWYFYVVNHWDDEQHFNRPMSFWNVRYWRYVPSYGFEFEKKNLHCGVAPAWAYHYGVYTDKILKHFGLMEIENRVRKSDRYKKFDPQAQYKTREFYNSLTNKQVVDEYDENKFQEELTREVSSYKQTPKKPFNNMVSKKFVFLEREDGSVIDIPEKHLQLTLKQHPKWKLHEQVVSTSDEDTEGVGTVAPPEVILDPLECLLCGYVGTSEHGMKIHKGRNHQMA